MYHNTLEVRDVRVRPNSSEEIILKIEETGRPQVRSRTRESSNALGASDDHSRLQQHDDPRRPLR
jgi:hypothetical protein